MFFIQYLCTFLAEQQSIRGDLFDIGFFVIY
jgi:hypothetical protein